MIIYHEAPLSIFDEVQKLTGGDYCLVHLLKLPEYRNKFKQAVEKGRTVLLDNSLFELREKFDSKMFVQWIEWLKPTYAIIPDVWHDCEGTIESYKQFVSTYDTKNLPCKLAGVAQGETLIDVIKCYKVLAEKCDMICFNFDARWFCEEFGNLPDRLRMSIGRKWLIHVMDDLGVINETKQHHLLGCGIPGEAGWYKDLPFITSIDTCHPVVEGMVLRKYNQPYGILEKTPIKLCDLIDQSVNEEQFKMIVHNINAFKQIAEKGEFA